MELFSANRKAPDFTGINAWLNTKPLTMSELKGKVVLVDFWTYTCINCLRTLPYIRAWHEKYAKKGLVIVGVHAPEFEFEGKLENVKDAVKRLNVKWPVALDSDMATWNAFSNHYWPAKYLVDKNGVIRYTHFGEGGYKETERQIQQLLGIKESLGEETQPSYTAGQSPETYAGSARGEIGSSGVCLPGGACRYLDQGKHERDIIYLQGEWHQEKEHVEGTGHFAYKFFAKEVNIVIDPLKTKSVDVTIDGKPIADSDGGSDVKNGKLALDSRRMYNVFRSKKPREAELRILPKTAIRAFALTFG
ncbi:MAG TPA: redoxin family protein [Candidatus Norongarragalinales archaeon]|nr:redoxin family protein [Candidatus Norongarragalinales archaeon]